jgi:hypothetical protein
MHPARQADDLIFMRKAKLATGMSAIGMHEEDTGVRG